MLAALRLLEFERDRVCDLGPRAHPSLYAAGTMMDSAIAAILAVLRLESQWFGHSSGAE